jgi:hypothetical protein
MWVNQSKSGESRMKKTSKTIALKVAWHASGNRTLVQSIDGAHTDLQGVFFCNSNPAEFYRAVAKLIANLAGQGYQIVYQDTEAACDTAESSSHEIGEKTMNMSKAIVLEDVAAEAVALRGAAHSRPLTELLKLNAHTLGSIPKSDPSDGFIERVKRELAKRNGVDLSKVIVEFRIVS